jgi:Alpha/beta hydrolase of unknown function (DUF900)
LGSAARSMRARCLNFRRSSRGGGALDEHEATESAHAPSGRLILLIHGYNVPRAKAENSYRQFQEHLSRFAPNIAADICWVFWPGDAWLPGASELSYPWQVRRALSCAPGLAEYLTARHTATGRPSRLILLGHSLGCRFILESLSYLLRKDTNCQVDCSVILMAAAVPVEYVKKGPLATAAAFAKPTHVLYSESDSVLRRYFGVGQAMAGEIGGAVGLRGQPSESWQFRREMKGFDHDDYWQRSEAAQVVAYWLGGSAPPPTAQWSPAQLKLFPHEVAKNWELPVLSLNYKA